MDILDGLLEHDAQATRDLLALCQSLSDAQWERTFDIGQGSLRDTFDHMIDSMEYWTSLMKGQPFSPHTERSIEGIARRFEIASAEFIALAKQMRDENRLDDKFVDNELQCKRTMRATIIHVTTHSMHHRAQIRVLFDLLGVEYNPFAGYALDAHPLD